jgi:hypothetical protein
MKGMKSLEWNQIIGINVPNENEITTNKHYYYVEVGVKENTLAALHPSILSRVFTLFLSIQKRIE